MLNKRIELIKLHWSIYSYTMTQSIVSFPSLLSFCMLFLLCKLLCQSIQRQYRRHLWWPIRQSINCQMICESPCNWFALVRFRAWKRRQAIHPWLLLHHFELLNIDLWMSGCQWWEEVLLIQSWQNIEIRNALNLCKLVESMLASGLLSTFTSWLRDASQRICNR